MQKYRVLEKSFINNRIVEAGEEIEYDGKPSDNLELIKQPKAAKVEPSAVGENKITA